jgi:hypothetical protein
LGEPSVSAAASQDAPAPPATSGDPVTLDQLVASFDDLLENVEQRVRARFRLGHFTEVDGDTVTFSLPNEHVLPRCEEVRSDVEVALQARFGRPLVIHLDVDGSAAAPAPPTSVAQSAPVEVNPTSEEIADVAHLDAATDVAASGIERLTEAFPGATVIDSPPE